MKQRTKQALILGGLALAGVAYACARDESDLSTVPSLDLKRYVGRWFEIARYPNRFQKQCSGDTTATYTVLSDGKIEVLNQCRKADGQMDVAKGKAKIADETSKAKLRVTFFWPFYGDYWVIGLDPGYRWAVVGEPGRKYLWILSRTEQMNASDYDQAIGIIRQKGYDPSKLIKTPQGTLSAGL
jgi:apolipoprotein D and lipocalin family protein